MTMRAISVLKFGEPSVLQLRSVAMPPSPGAHEVLLRVRAVGVNPVDGYIRSGNYGRLPASMPYTPGSDCAGVVEQVGEGVTALRQGDAVYTFGATTGAYAEYTLARDSQTFRLPYAADAPLAFQWGACLGVPYFTAYRALFTRGHAKPNETMLVRGATGGVGIACVQMGLAHGMKVFGTSGSEGGSELLKRLGVHHVLPHDCKEQVLSLTEGKGVNCIVEMLAHKNLASDLQMLAVHGRVLVVGNRGSIEVNPRDAMSKESDVRGVLLFHGTPEEFDEAASYIDAGCRSGSLRPEIGRTFPLSEAAAAHEAVTAATDGKQGKILLLP